MYIRGLIPRNFAKLAEVGPIGSLSVSFKLEPNETIRSTNFDYHNLVL